jgi:hypothetical protein
VNDAWPNAATVHNSYDHAFSVDSLHEGEVAMPLENRPVRHEDRNQESVLESEVAGNATGRPLDLSAGIIALELDEEIEKDPTPRRLPPWRAIRTG